MSGFRHSAYRGMCCTNRESPRGCRWPGYRSGPRTLVIFSGAVLKISSPRAMLACCGLALFLQA